MDKKYIDSIRLPNNIDSIIDNAISRAERNRNKKKNRMKIAATSIFISSLAIFSLTNRTFADNVPFLGKVFENADIKKNNYNNDYNKYAKGINVTETYGSISMKIDQAACDGNSIYISTVITNKNGFKVPSKSEYNPWWGYQICPEDETRVNFNYYGDTEDKSYRTLLSNGLIGNFIDDNTFIGVAKYDLAGFKGEVPDKFRLKIGINALNYDFSEKNDKPNHIISIFNFAFDVTKIGSSEIKTVIPNLNSKDIKVEKICFTPFSTNVTFSIPKELEKRFEIPTLYDETGHEITGFSSTAPELSGDNRYIYVCSYDKFPKNSKNMKIKFLPDSESSVIIPILEN